MTYAISGVEVPVEIIREYRRNVRISCGVDKLYLRLPVYCGENETHRYITWGKHWAQKNWHKHAWFRERFRPKVYTDGQEITTTYDTFVLRLTPSSSPDMRGSIRTEQVTIEHPGLFPDSNSQNLMHRLVHKLLAKHYRAFVIQKLHTLNTEHFRQEVRGVRLSLQNTRWGSCSSNGRISLSTKLLFAPEPVMDYVIIHELAHLIEHNHSGRFWNLVAGAMPEYGKYEQWLKDHGHLCD